MTLTLQAAKAAVQKYLPTEINYTRSADFGELDRDQVFSRVSHITYTALLLDRDAVFYITYLSAQRLLGTVDSCLAALVSLEGEDGLRGVSSIAPVRASDLSSLVDAREDLLSLSGSLVTGVFGTFHFEAFKTDVGEFLNTQIKPNLDGGNRAKTEASLRGAAETLAAAWAQTHVQLDGLLSIVPGYASADLRTLVAGSVVASVQTSLTDLQALLPTQSATEQALAAEAVLLDISAAQAALQVIGDAASPFGTVIATGSDGSTLPDYLVLQGSGQTSPPSSLHTGTDGAIGFDDIIASTTGVLLNIGGDSIQLTDSSVPTFVGATEGMYLVFADTGRVHKVVSSTTGSLTFSPATAYVSGYRPYLITVSTPGTRFVSASADFWEAHTTGATGSASAASGSDGAFVVDSKLEVSDATDLRANGVTGTTHPYKTEGTGDSVSASAVFEDASGSFVTSGLAPGDDFAITSGANTGTYEIASVESETSLTLTSPLANTVTGQAYWAGDPDAGTWFEDVSATFLSDGFEAGDVITIATAPSAGTHVIVSVLSQTVVKIGAVPRGTSLVWEARYLPGEVYSEDADFIGAGIVPGDKAVLDGVTGDVLAVSAHLLETTHSTTLYTAKTLVVAASLTASTLFTSATDFVALGIGPVMSVTEYYAGTAVLTYKAGVVTVNGDPYTISANGEAATQLRLSPVGVVGTSLNWEVLKGESSQRFSDVIVSPFNSYKPGDILVYRPGTGQERRLPIAEVLTPSQVRLDGSLPQGETDIPYALIRTIAGGQELLTAGCRVLVRDVLNATTLRVDKLPLAIGTGLVFNIVRRGQDATTTLLSDKASAETWGVAGFGSDFAGRSLETLTGRPFSGTIKGVLDLDGDSVFETFDLGGGVDVGQRDVEYRVRVAESLTSGEVATSVDVSDIEVGDLLTLWEAGALTPIASAGTLEVTARVPARLSDLNFCVVRGGSPYHGGYVLFSSLLEALNLDVDTSTLRLRLAEVLIDFGAGASLPVVSGSAGDSGLTGDGVGYLVDAAADFSDVEVGDRVVIGASAGYVMGFLPTGVLLSPPLPAGSGQSWVIDKNSVAGALNEVSALKAQLESLRSILLAYVIPTNQTVVKVLDLLRDRNMDRAVEMLYSGDIEGFVSMDDPASSFSSEARRRIQTVGQATTSAPGIADGSFNSRLGGIDPATGRGSPYSKHASSLGRGFLSSDPKVRIAFAQAVAHLSADERARSLTSLTVEEMRNQAVYLLTGEVLAASVSDNDPTLPWLAVTGSIRDRLQASTAEVLEALQYCLDHPEEFTDVGAS